MPFLVANSHVLLQDNMIFIDRTSEHAGKETMIIELQGELQCRVQGNLDGKFIGNLVFTNEVRYCIYDLI